MMKILETYEGVFTDVPGKSNLIEHRILLNNEDPVRSKLCPLPYAVREELKGEIKDQSWALGTLKVTTISVPILC